MKNIWFVGDWHFCHDKEFVFKKRGFNSIEEMNETIVKRHNTIVAPDDMVYVLGDCALGNTIHAIEYIKQMNGHKILIIGNHDTDERIKTYVKENLFEDIQFGARLKASKHKRFYLSHYPSLVGNFDASPNIWNISAHTHSKEKFEIGDKKIYCVSMDAHNCYPVNLETILNDINKRRQDYDKTHSF